MTMESAIILGGGGTLAATVGMQLVRLTSRTCQR